MEYEPHSMAIMRHETNITNMQGRHNDVINTVSLPILPNINYNKDSQQNTNYNSGFNTTNDRQMVRNMTENRMQVYDAGFTTQYSDKQKNRDGFINKSRSSTVIKSPDYNYDSKKSLELIRKDDKSSNQNKTRAEIDILGNILQENAETLTFTKNKCVQNNS